MYGGAGVCVTAEAESLNFALGMVNSGRGAVCPSSGGRNRLSWKSTFFFANHYSAYCAPPPPQALNLTVAANKSRVPAQKLQLFPRILQLFSPNLRQMDFSLTRSQKIQS